MSLFICRNIFYNSSYTKTASPGEAVLRNNIFVKALLRLLRHSFVSVEAF